MKTKDYTFNFEQILAIREALTHYYHEVSKSRIDSPKTGPLARVFHSEVRHLKELFTDDARLF
jgi:hypothetical protein